MDREKIVVLTGGNAGIGLAAAKALVGAGVRLALVSRDRERGAAAQRALGAERVDLFAADLSSQKQVRRLATELCARYPQIDVLINNAAAVYSQRTLSEDGIEMQLAINHLAPFLLTHLLLERLRGAGEARVVNVTSRAHARGSIDFDDLSGERGYYGLTAYNQSKLAMVLFTYELARRLQGSGITANCVHPGVVRTEIGYKHTTRFHAFLHSLLCLIGSGADEGARGVVRLALAPELRGESGLYFDRMRRTRSSAASYDEDLARRLWGVSAALTGVAAD